MTEDENTYMGQTEGDAFMHCLIFLLINWMLISFINDMLI